jgi:hypothetical protein
MQTVCCCVDEYDFLASEIAPLLPCTRAFVGHVCNRLQLRCARVEIIDTAQQGRTLQDSGHVNSSDCQADATLLRLTIITDTLTTYLLENACVTAPGRPVLGGPADSVLVIDARLRTELITERSAARRRDLEGLVAPTTSPGTKKSEMPGLERDLRL